MRELLSAVSSAAAAKAEATAGAGEPEPEAADMWELFTGQKEVKSARMAVDLNTLVDDVRLCFPAL